MKVLYDFVCPRCGQKSFLECYQYGFAERVVVYDIIDRSRLRHLAPEPAEGEFVSYYRCGRCKSRLCETEQEAAQMIAACAFNGG